jgi:hypothetical protein
MDKLIIGGFLTLLVGYGIKLAVDLAVQLGQHLHAILAAIGLG